MENVLTPTVVDIDILARTMWGEARGEGEAGMWAVGCVIANRVESFRWPNTFKAVCLQPWQFSCWNTDDPNRAKLLAVDFNDEAFAHAYAMAALIVLNPEHDDTTRGANHYMTDALYKGDARPTWATKMARATNIGQHVFLIG